MLRPRVIPALLLRDRSLVETVQFGRFRYIGDPTNAVRMFNELQGDELAFLDITATIDGREPNIGLFADIANESFMPLAYGGGVRAFAQAQAILGIGYEKIVITTRAVEEPTFIRELAEHFGSQAVIVSIDGKERARGQPTVRTLSGCRDTGLDPVAWAQEVERRGAREILLTSIDREGTWRGYDLGLARRVAEAIRIPLDCNGGPGRVEDLGAVIRDGCASAAAAGSMVLFQKQGMGVLVNFPSLEQLATAFDSVR